MTPDVVVIGAGPAGSLAARECARRGADVLLVDKARFPRSKVCGSCVNLHAAAVLREVGLGDLLPSSSAVRLERLNVGADGRSAVVLLPGGFALSRESLDSCLVAAAVRAGVTFRDGTRAKDLGPGGRGRRVQVGNEVIDACVLIDASGLAASGPPRPGSRIGAGVMVDAAPVDSPPGTIHMACGRSGYVGFTLVEGGRLDVAAAFDADAVRAAGGMGPLAERIVAASGLPDIPGLADAGWRGTPALTRRATSLAEPGLLRVGDAAAFVEPFTGQGIAWALAGGAAVAPLAVGPAEGRERRWTSVWSTAVGRRQRECETLSRVLRRPRLTTALVSLVARMPSLAAPVVRSINRKGAA